MGAARRHHTGILRRGVWCASRRPPLGVRLFLSLFAVLLRFSLQPSCHLAVAPFSLLPLSRRRSSVLLAAYPGPSSLSSSPRARTSLLTPTAIICRPVISLLRSTLSSNTCAFTDDAGAGVPFGCIVSRVTLCPT